MKRSPFLLLLVIPSVKTAERPMFEVTRLLFTPAGHWCVERPLPKYKVSGTYMPQTCSKLAASLRLIVAASLLQTRFSYANFFSGALFWPTMCAASMPAHSCSALFWHTMCAASLRRTVAAHCTGTQCVPEECSAQLSRTILAYNVRRTVAAHYSCVPQLCGAQLPCTSLFCPPPLPPYPHPPPHPLV